MNKTGLAAFMSFCLLSGRLPAAAGEGAQVTEIRFELQPRTESKAALDGSLILRMKGEELRLPVKAGKAEAAKLPVSTVWEVSVDVAGYWAPGEVLRVGEASTVHGLSVWPAGKISGSLRMMDAGEPFPARLEARTGPPPVSRSKKSEIPKGSMSCPVDEKGAWTCEVPAGTLDLAFRAPGFVPQYRWGLEPKAGETLPAGILELRKGASLSGWVEVEGGAIAEGRCTARLKPLLGPGSSGPQLTARLQKASAERKVLKDGFFQLEGIAPGSYVLEVEQPGYAVARAFPLEIWERAETGLKQPVLLRRPLQIELSIAPPLDWLGRPWEVQVSRGADFSAGVDEPAYQGPVEAGGHVKIAGQAPGNYWVRVADSLGNGLYSQRDLRIEDQEDARLVIEIEILTVRGKVSLGKEPLAATLWFGGEHGALRVAIMSDEEGAFQGVLPRGGPWRVDVRAADPKIETHAKVEVNANRDGEAELDIKLPDTSVFGKVVDERDRPRPGARVSLATLVDEAGTRADEDGSFHLRSFPEGKGSLSASFSSADGELTSDEFVLEAVDSRPVGPVTLILRSTKAFSGRVQSSRGPIAGAVVQLSPLVPRTAYGAMARTGLDGSFSKTIPGKTERLSAIVSAPGHSLKAFEIPVIGDRVILHVSEEAGHLQVALPFSREQSEAQGLGFIIYQNGLLLPNPTLYRWAAGHGALFWEASEVHVPRLAPGPYEVCLAPPALVEDWDQSPRTERRCASGYLGDGATLQLDLAKKKD
jgi:hypothetical protein